NQYSVLRTYKSKHQHEYNVGASDLAVIDHSQDKNIINEVSINESQKILEKLIGMDSLTFQNSVFFGQKATRFMDSPSGDKRKIFEDILSGIIGDINDLHGKVSNDRTSKMGEIQLLTNKVSKLEGRVEALRSRYKELGE